MLPPVIFAIAPAVTAGLDWLLPFDVVPPWQDRLWYTWLSLVLAGMGITLGIDVNDW